MSVNLLPDESRLVLELLSLYIRNAPASDPNLSAAASAYGRISAGDYMSPEESCSAFGETWHISITGRRLAPEPSVVVTQKRYFEEAANALLARGMKLRSA